MAQGTLMVRFAVSVSDVDRGVYEELDLRVAMHPSESRRHLCARVLAYGLEHEEGIELGRGVSTADEPAVWVRDGDGRVRRWIEVGAPSAERLHKASKLADEVAVYLHRGRASLDREIRRKRIHRLEAIRAYELDAALLDALESDESRSVTWQLTRTDGRLYVVAEDRALEAPLSPLVLGDG